MKRSNKHLYIIILISFFCEISFAQKEKIILRKGNDAYHTGKPLEAANYYKQSLKEKQTYYKSNFNLGDALYKTADLLKAGKIQPPNKNISIDSAAKTVYEQAANQFEVVAKSVSNADTIQKAWHNFGNSKLMQNNYEDAILGYKKALKLNSKDEDTRYNLAYAQKKLAEQKKNQKNKDDKKNQNKDDKKENQKNKNEKKDIENKNKQEEQQPQMNKEQAEKMLNALKNNEKKMQSLRKKKGDPAQKIKVEKDW